MHMDHCVGVVPLLSTAMSIFSARAQSSNNDPDKLHIEIYGTPGLRQLIRSTLNLTHMNLSGKYIVHELHLSEGDTRDEGLPHPNEIIGINIQANSQQFWQNIGSDMGITIDAGSIEHRVTCVGYVFTERPTVDTIPRRLVCLGDTSSASHIVPLCISEGIRVDTPTCGSSSLVWRSAKDVCRISLYGRIAVTSMFRPQSVREKAISKGHSTPDMAGAFARSVQAERLALIHFSAMFKNPSPNDPIMREIARQATVAWGRRGVNAMAAHDLYWMDIPPRPVVEAPESRGVQPSSGPSATVWDAHLWEDPLEPDQPMPQNLKRKWDNSHRGAGGFRENRNRGGGRGRGRGRGHGGGRGDERSSQA
ncbi:hypothetical protein RSAG8_00643, partial [Rhizoctonia solani AG-8 WAC10335]